jgi:uncharacterized membrane protein HdeD (DUF308 family)
MDNPSFSTNRNAIYSLVAVILTVITFCIGLAPIPLTAIPCYPTSLVFGVVALVTGTRALRQIRASRENGRWMALTGVWLGALTMLAVVCATTLTLALLPSLFDYLKQAWGQIKP